jgi:hypothetical protein
MVMDLRNFSHVDAAPLSAANRLAGVMKTAQFGKRAAARLNGLAP